MPLLMNLFDESQSQHETPCLDPPAYHPPSQHYKIIHQGLIIPNLPAPLHYFNFVSFMGQPNVPILRNQSALIHRTALDTATVLCSISGHMTGQFNTYSIQQECELRHHYYAFQQREKLIGDFPVFNFQREDNELSVDLQITTSSVMTHITKLKLPLLEYWSLLCHCEGRISYQGQSYPIHHLGTFDFARSIHVPYFPISFFTYQVINLNQSQQISCIQVRDNLNHIVQSKIYLKDLNRHKVIAFHKHVRFKIKRIYPQVKTPNQHKMYLPREFEWWVEDRHNKIHIKAESRGDFKFGLGAGYVGSFHYQIQINENHYLGEGGYCEYIDCRPLRWQEIDKAEKNSEELANSMPILIKK